MGVRCDGVYNWRPESETRGLISGKWMSGRGELGFPSKKVMRAQSKCSDSVFWKLIWEKGKVAF